MPLANWFLCWLFNFHANYSRPNVNKNQISVVNHAKRSLLEKTCDLIRNFPEYLDVVVSVARKTDGRHWADLFTAAGRSTEYVLQASMLWILISILITMWNALFYIFVSCISLLYNKQFYLLLFLLYNVIWILFPFG